MKSPGEIHKVLGKVASGPVDFKYVAALNAGRGSAQPTISASAVTGEQHGKAQQFQRVRLWFVGNGANTGTT